MKWNITLHSILTEKKKSAGFGLVFFLKGAKFVQRHPQNTSGQNCQASLMLRMYVTTNKMLLFCYHKYLSTYCVKTQVWLS